MNRSTFMYVTYIRTTPEKLWSALTDPATMKQYWFGMHQDSDWLPGSAWKLVFPDGRIADAGEIVEAEAPSKFIEAVTGGWPKILSNIKSLLETGQVVMDRK